MALKRVLQYFNIAILFALILLAFAVYWWAWRPLPQTSGTVMAPISRTAVVRRDAIGLPHVWAGEIQDALFLQGYATAQDRLWQMDALRRLAGGTLAEVFGPELVEMDREARRFRMERIAQMHTANLAAGERAIIAAYARGVNYFIETHRGRLPVEFTLLGYSPRPWRIEDSVLIALYMYRELTSTWRDEIKQSVMLASGDPAKVRQLFPARAGGDVQPGSNAWVLGGSRTATGRPLLANDPHLEYSIPSIWHMVHLRAPGLNVSGVTLPGLPGIILGHNDRIAWGATNLGFDVQDLYIEKIDLRTGRYTFRGQVEQAKLERELIQVKGRQPVEFAQWVTRHGPVFVDRGQALALRWTAAQPGGFAFPIIDLDRSRNWQEFTAALGRYPGPGQNFVFAGTDGNIGYHAAGLLPIRRNYEGNLPVDGSSGEYEWDGYIPFAQLPQAYNPPSAMIVTANQNPFSENYPYHVGGNFAAPYRARRIHDLLSVRGKWRVADMLGIQTDVYSSFGHFIAREIVGAYGRRPVKGSEAAAAISVLREWKGRMDDASAAPLVVVLTYEHLRQALAEQASPSNALLYGNGLPLGAAYQMGPVVVQDVLSTKAQGWFGNYDDFLLRGFTDALDEGRRIQGRNLQNWTYGTYNRLFLAHPVGNRLPLVAKYFDIGPVGQSGSPTTVMQTTRRLGPSMRTAVDLANVENAYMNIVAGESGHVLSSHYKDQWEYYRTGRSFPMQFNDVEVKDKLVFEPLPLGPPSRQK